MKGFMDFVREQGVVGLAVGFILGGSVSNLVSALVEDIIDPILGIALGAAGTLTESSIKFGGVELMTGHFLTILIDFLVVALVVYYGVSVLGLDNLDKKKKK